MFVAWHGADRVETARNHDEQRRCADEAGFFRGQAFVGIGIFPLPDAEQGLIERFLRRLFEYVQPPRGEIAVIRNTGRSAQDEGQFVIAGGGIGELRRAG